VPARDCAIARAWTPWCAAKIRKRRVDDSVRDSKLQFGSLNHALEDAINSEPAFPESPPNRTCCRYAKIDENDPKRTFRSSIWRVGLQCAVAILRLGPNCAGNHVAVKNKPAYTALKLWGVTLASGRVQRQLAAIRLFNLTVAR